jgi:hypothetical protein
MNSFLKKIEGSKLAWLVMFFFLHLIEDTQVRRASTLMATSWRLEHEKRRRRWQFWSQTQMGPEFELLHC